MNAFVIWGTSVSWISIWWICTCVIWMGWVRDWGQMWGVCSLCWRHRLCYLSTGCFPLSFPAVTSHEIHGRELVFSLCFVFLGGQLDFDCRVFFNTHIWPMSYCIPALITSPVPISKFSKVEWTAWEFSWLCVWLKLIRSQFWQISKWTNCSYLLFIKYSFPTLFFQNLVIYHD